MIAVPPAIVRPLALAIIFSVLFPSSSVIEGGFISHKDYKPVKVLKAPTISTQNTLDSVYDSEVLQASINTVLPVNCGSDPNMAFIYQHESGCSTTSVNASSGAYGLCQSLPGSKIASAGADWQTSWDTQNSWCISYANSRYGSPYLAMLAWENQGWW